MNGQAGKGDTYRPTNQKAYGENYDAIFRKGKYAEAPADQTADKQANCGHRYDPITRSCPRCGLTEHEAVARHSYVKTAGR